MLPIILLSAHVALATPEEAPAEVEAQLAAVPVEDEGAEPGDAADSAEPEIELPEDPAELRAALRQQLVESEAPADQLDGMVEWLASRVEMERSLQYQTGEITLGDGLATLSLGEEYRFLGPEDATRVVVAWGNPAPGTPPLGMVLTAGSSPMDPESWAVIVQYEADGHVDDADAASTDYDELLAGMQEATRASNEARTAAGYEALELVGWAEPPHYDAEAKKLYWAKHLRSEGGSTLNYDIRALGRRGVLSMQAVSGMEQLEAVRTGMAALLPRVDFNEGERYADFDPSVDKVAAFGIGALIAGKVAAKAGFFKLLIAGLLAGKKFVLLAVAGVVAAASRLFGGKSTPEGPSDAA
ncbi:MAG: DUF2167 domain-containing protein [Alphaproteobacteria bacterium]|nr:DUF2167 domain-containing protein [Alphaproteobacteria bacterium]